MEVGEGLAMGFHRLPPGRYVDFPPLCVFSPQLDAPPALCKVSYLLAFLPSNLYVMPFQIARL